MSLANWSQSTDTLQVGENSYYKSPRSGNGSVDKYSSTGNDEDFDTRTITGVPVQSTSSISATFIVPLSSSLSNPSNFILTFEREDLLNTKLCTPDGRIAYNISTKSNGSEKPMGSALITSVYKTGCTIVSRQFIEGS